MRLLSLFLSLSLLPGALFAGQSEISARMKSLADGLVTSYRAKHPAAAKEKIAIFEFTSTKELKERHVGHAVSELLTHHINGDSGFVLLERLELNKIMGELKLSMAGVTDQEDALKAGKLGGAKAIVLGSVEKLGDKYHVNARLVDVESGEVSATAYEAMPVSIFEEEAKDYIVYVPKKQRIGIYLLINWRHNSNDVAFNASASGDGEVSPEPFDIGLVGFGVRYAPSKSLLIDLSYMANSSIPRGGRDRTIPDYTSPGVFNQDRAYGVGVKAYRGLASYGFELSRKCAGFVGGGLTYYQFQQNLSAGYISPSMQVRGEYFPQERIGLSLAATYDMLNKTATSESVSEAVRRTRNMAKLGKISVESSVSLYF